MKQIILILIFTLTSIIYGMKEQEKANPTFVPGHRRTNSLSHINLTFQDPELKKLSQKLPAEASISRQKSDLPNLDPMSLYLKSSQKVIELNEKIKKLKNDYEDLEKINKSLKQEVADLKQPNKFVNFYVAASLSYVIGTVLYFTYPRWLPYIKLPHLLPLKK